jgi:hypothetical protein
VLQRQPQVLLAAAAVQAAEAVDPAVLRHLGAADKRLLHAYSWAGNQRAVPARVREGRHCTAERLEPERRDYSNLEVVLEHSLVQEVSAVVAAVAADVAAAAGIQQELAVAKKWAHSVAKHPSDEDHRHRVLDVVLDNSDKVVPDRAREVLRRDRLVPRSLSLLAPTVGQDTVATLLLDANG